MLEVVTVEAKGASDHMFSINKWGQVENVGPASGVTLACAHLREIMLTNSSNSLMGLFPYSGTCKFKGNEHGAAGEALKRLFSTEHSAFVLFPFPLCVL